jgi:putative tricarboxylic transport membrane protein
MMRSVLKTLAAAGMALALAAGGASAQSKLGDLTITAPAGAGGGWDTTARSLQQVLTSEGISPSVQVINVPGAGGTVGLAQFAPAAKTDARQLLLAGITLSVQSSPMAHPSISAKSHRWRA